MAFLSLGSDYLRAGYTQVDNVFLLSYLPYADALDVKIYLLGLVMASDASEENSLEKMAIALHTDEERIAEGFRYWEEKGLVSLTKTAPFSVKYLSVKNPLKPVVKLNGEKYKVFADEVARLFPERIMSPNEYNAYFELMHDYKVETNAMLLIMQYCKDLGGGRFSTPYILAVATDWAKNGLTTEKKVTEHIEELENNSEDIRQIFSALGIKRAADLTDRQLYLKWTKKKNFPLDSILAAAKSLKKRGGTEKLDELMEELEKAGAFNVAAVADYIKEKESVHALAKDLAKTLGSYYGSTDAIVDSYVRPWLNVGFDEEGLKKLAKFCFLRNIRSFDGLSQTVDKFYRNGVLSSSAIDVFVEKQLKIDEDVKEVFDKCNNYGVVSNRDRECYRAWNEWGFDKEAILAAAESCSGEIYPMQAINRTLASLRADNIFSAGKIKEKLSEKQDKSNKKGKNDDYMKHVYSDEQLKNVLVNFDDWEN